MADIAAVTAELADLWTPEHIADALARDTSPAGGAHGWAAGASAVVNADVLHAAITLGAQIPAAVRAACDQVAEPWQPRDMHGCLTQIPRLHARLCELRLAREERQLAADAAAWLRLAKRALGLRKPDMPLGWACPYAESFPDEHQDGRMLSAAGAEGFLRDGPDGPHVEWVVQERIYCESPDCEAAWPKMLWPHLGKLLGTPAMAAA